MAGCTGLCGMELLWHARYSFPVAVYLVFIYTLDFFSFKYVYKAKLYCKLTTYCCQSKCPAALHACVETTARATFQVASYRSRGWRSWERLLRRSSGYAVLAINLKVWLLQLNLLYLAVIDHY